MDWIKYEFFGFCCPAFADEFVRSEALEGLEAATEIVGSDKIFEVRS